MKSQIQERVDASFARGGRKAGLPISLLALTLSAFAIGTTEFIIMGLLPNVAGDLHVSLQAAGFLVSGYALTIVISGPLLTALAGSLPRKTFLVALMGLFIIGNLLAAIAPTYVVLLAARILAAMVHGAFFGVGSVVAAQLVPPQKKASAIAIMFAGLTISNILGVPLGTFVGQQLGWHVTFWTVTAMGVLAFLSLVFLLPHNGTPRAERENASGLRMEFAVLLRPQVLLALLMTIFGFGSVFTVFTYITPLLEQVSGFSPTGVSLLLVLFGVGSAIGIMLGGKSADRSLIPSLLVILSILTIVLLVFTWMSHYQIATIITMFLFGAAAFATIPGLQTRVVDEASGAPEFASAFNIAAFNLGNAGGSFIGGLVITSVLGLSAITWVGALITIVGMAFTAWSGQRERSQLELTRKDGDPKVGD